MKRLIHIEQAADWQKYEENCYYLKMDININAIATFFTQLVQGVL